MYAAFISMEEKLEECKNFMDRKGFIFHNGENDSITFLERLGTSSTFAVLLFHEKAVFHYALAPPQMDFIFAFQQRYRD